MLTILSLGLAALLQMPVAPGMHELTLDVPDAGRVLYGVSVPRGYSATTPAPLVVVLHSGGQRMRYYGLAFTKLLVEPALRDLGAVIVAPDCPTSSWSDAAADATVMAVVAEAMKSYNIDRTRVIVTGYSMGGRGTWYQASKHADLYTAAIPMAASVDGIPADTLARQPTYIVHSRDDEVVPFGPAERNAKALEKSGRNVHFEAVDGFTHFEMFRYVDALKRGGQWVTARWQEKRGRK